MSNIITSNTSTPAYQIDNGAPINTVRWSATGLPEGLTINQETGFITGSPEYIGDYTATITVETEWGNASCQRTFHIILPPFPIIGSAKRSMVFPNQKFTYQIIGKTYDKDTGDYIPSGIVEYTLEDAPEGMTINTETGYIEWDCPYDIETPSEFTIIVGIKDIYDRENSMGVTVDIVKPAPLEFHSPNEALVYPSDKLIYKCEYVGEDIIEKSFNYDQTKEIIGFKYDNETFDIEYDVPLETEPYELPIQMELRDKYNQYAELNLIIKVIEPPEPIMVTCEPENIYLDDIYSYQIVGRTISEITGKEVNEGTKYFIESAPNGMFVNENTGLIIWDMDVDAPRKVNMYAGMTNKYGKTSRIPIEINTIIPDDWAPELDDGDEYTCYVGSQIDPYEVTGINIEKNMD